MRFTALIAFLFSCFFSYAQENSPYSRYGLGDLVPQQNMISRSMGGISAGYSDFQSINFINPASYSNLSISKRSPCSFTTSFFPSVIFDVAAEGDARTLKTVSPVKKYTATNLLFSYLQLGLPVRMKKTNKKGLFLGVNMGIRPVTNINYKILKSERLPIDSLSTLYTGSGGINQIYGGAGLSYKNFSAGFNLGYMFGNKDYSTQVYFHNDTVSYYNSNSSTKTNFGGVFINGGLQYTIPIKDTITGAGAIKFGVYGNLDQKLKAKRDVVRETVVYDASGNSYRIDSIFDQKDIKGTIVYPEMLGAGVSYKKGHWMLGADFEMTKWNGYRYYGQADEVRSNWKVRAGAEFFPADCGTPVKKFLHFVSYRAGFYYGPDYIKVNNKTLPEYAFTFGFGIPLKLRKNYYETQYSILNTAFEIGARGDKKSNLRENIFRFGIGLSLTDRWFRQAKYD